MPPSRAERRGRKAALIAAVGVALAFATWKISRAPFDDRDFDRATWSRMRGSDERDNPRGQMLDDLVEDLEARRPSRDEVIVMLGPTESECAVLSPPIGPKDTCLSYILGMWSGFRIDYDTLDVYFGDDGRVRKAMAVQH